MKNAASLLVCMYCTCQIIFGQAVDPLEGFDLTIDSIKIFTAENEQFDYDANDSRRITRMENLNSNSRIEYTQFFSLKYNAKQTVDDDNRLIHSRYTYFDSEDNTLVTEIGNSEYQYEGNVLKTKLYSRYNLEDDDWFYTRQDFSLYDAYNNENFIKQEFSLDSLEWEDVNEVSYERFYSNGVQDSVVTIVIGQPSNDYSETAYNYNENGLTDLREIYHKANSGEVRLKSRTNYYYDDLNRLDYFVYAAVPLNEFENSGELVLHTKTDYVYNNQNKVEQVNYYSFDTELNEFVANYLKRYYRTPRTTNVINVTSDLKITWSNQDHGRIDIQLSSDSSTQDYEISVFNTIGQKVRSKIVTGDTEFHHLIPGNYFIRIQDQLGKSKTEKVIVM